VSGTDSRRGRRIALYVVGLALIAALFVVLWGRPRAPREEALGGEDPSARKDRPAEPAEAPKRRPGGEISPQGPAGKPESGAPGEAQDARERRLERARHVLDTYLAWARYPPESRPMSEQPDQVRPHFVAPQKVPLARSDQKLTDAKVTLEQDRFFVVGDEEVAFTMTCETSDGPATCEVLSSLAGVPAHALAQAKSSGAVPAEVPVTFSDSGQDGDREAGDGTLTGVLAPARQGFQEYHGPIRLALELRVEGETGKAAFDIVYTPRPPAMFTRKVREAIEGGSLNLYAELEVDKPGRYMIAGRVDDDTGKSFAYVTFNEELGAGRQEARLVVFGKLIRDEKAKAPFRLRDVEGYLFKEDAYPDRELLPTLEGAVYTTKRYKETDFSETEWQSEEKDRHVKEHRKDVEELSREAPEKAGGEP
jgi:hypothetical protein